MERSPIYEGNTEEENNGYVVFKLKFYEYPGCWYRLQQASEAVFLDEIQKKILRVFLLVIHSHLYSFALRFLFLQTHATSYSFCKREGGKPDRKPYPLSYGLRNPTETSSLRTLKIMPRKP